MIRHEDALGQFSHKVKEYYTRINSNLSQSELNQIRADARKVIQTNMESNYPRFSRPDDLQGVLPDSVNVNNEEEVKKFLIESADVFADILLTP